MKRLRDSTQSVPGGWKCQDPDTQVRIEEHSFKTLRGAWIAHRKANNLPYNNVENWIHEQICEREPKFCKDGLDPYPLSTAGIQNLPLAVMASNFTKEIIKWANSGFSTVNQEVFKARKEKCESCSYWDASAMNGLGRCNKCGCSGVKHHLTTTSCPLGLWTK